LSMLSLVCGFALTWHVWWMAAGSLLAIIAYAIWHSFDYDRDYHIPAAEVAATEAARTRQLELAHG
ncbi:MAG TPA: ubiquinol oxidase subunit 1, partial [Lysobacter sp.]